MPSGELRRAIQTESSQQGGDIVSVQYAIKDRDGKITQEPGKKDAKRDKKAYGGMIVRSKGG